MVEVLELVPLRHGLPHSLSGGERRRAAPGRASFAGPELLLLDEPLEAVDKELHGRVLDYIDRVAREWHVPARYVTHNLAEARRQAQCVVLRERG